MVSENYQLPISAIYDELVAKIKLEFNGFEPDAIETASREWRTPTLARNLLENPELAKAKWLPLEEYLRITDTAARNQLQAIARIDIGQLVDEYSAARRLTKSNGIKQLIKIFAQSLYPMMEQGIKKFLEGESMKYDFRANIYLAAACGYLSEEYLPLLIRLGVDKFPGYSDQQHQRDIPEVEDEIIQDTIPPITATITPEKNPSIKTEEGMGYHKNRKPRIVAPAPHSPLSSEQEKALLEKLTADARRREKDSPSTQREILVRIADLKR